ncbi:MAG: sigma-70 family RNA polymerase sigma factor [Chloroflexota bacterium]|nr:sigma-70 family RNA polymerase sigma factor [Chloroflexota bacterium]
MEQHAVATFRLAAAIVGEFEAADVTQDAFTDAWKQLPRLRQPESFTPWLRRICVNRCRTVLRRAASQRRGPSLDADPRVSIGLADRAPDFRLAIEARAILEPAYASLNADQRAVLALHYGMGLSLRETAAALGVRTGTAKSRLHAALGVLRRALGADATPANPHREAAR